MNWGSIINMAFNAKKKQKKNKNKPGITKAHVRGFQNEGWVANPDKPGWEINVMDMTERKVKR